MCHIPERVKEEIITYAKKYRVNKIYLFGSRASGTHFERSDIDIAFWGGDNPDEFIFNLKENLWTLLKIDVIYLDEMPKRFVEEVEKKGVILYEKV